MAKTIKRALFVFRRDLRLQDNTALAFALKHAEEVVLSFIFTPEQIEHNSYRSDHCLQFMIESLTDLEHEIRKADGRLYLFYGAPQTIIAQCIKTLKIDAVMLNCDYTPYSRKRDQLIEQTCIKHTVSFHTFHDLLLHPPEDTLKLDSKPYTVFTPFFRNASRLEVAKPLHLPKGKFYARPIDFAKDSTLYTKILPHRSPQQKGGRTEALKILKSLGNYTDYATLRDFPSVEATTHLSPHLKFTTCSAREVYHALVKHLGSDTPLIRSLYWRDFFTSIAFYFPHVFEGAFHKKFNRISWSRDKKKFQLWCEGKTGVPIVDAGMREMKETGFMHNRVRMIAGSFLIKDLHIDWRLGESYFAQTLIDYDPAVNNGNWQWVASTGCDAQPYFRIFNPWTQGKKFDPDCIYIKKWVPELRSLPPQAIHAWHLEKHHSLCPDYPKPLVSHEIESKKAQAMYRDKS
ncbi:MAG: DNA photolyase family protein [Rhabdochlamydiaceae bacterium]|nr:DNA photolyase family protein [Rhabdochlamydiaceae bacterium]